MTFRRSASDEDRFSYDPVAHARTVIVEEHRLIHDGMFFTARGIITGLAAAGTFDILLTTGQIAPHLRTVVFAFDDGPAQLELFEGTTVSAAGTEATVVNNNRLSDNTPQTVITIGPTVTDVGTSLGAFYLPVGVPGWEGPDIGEEFVLENNNQTYLVRFTNNTAGAITAGVKLAFYEVSYRT